MKNDNFKFFVPADIEKATDAAGKEVMKFKGIASTGHRDSQGEFLDPSGFDLKHFSWVNWNHKGSSDPATIIGEPTKAVINENNELYIEGILYPDVPMAKTTWALMKALQNSPTGNKLSLSIEGKVLQRASNDKNHPEYNRIIKSKITGVAICPVPVNANTWVDFLQKGYTEDLNEEFDEDTQKAMTAAAGEGVTQKEDVEGPKNKILNKGEVYEKIHDHFPSIDIEKAKSVYSLIQKITNIMNKNEDKTLEKISEETIAKAFEILDLAHSQTTITKSADADADDKGKEDEEDEDQKEMVKKAKDTCTVMKSEGKTADEIKGSLIKKGYGENVIAKAMAEDVNTPAVNGLSKSQVEDIIKGHIAGFDNKFNAVTTILKDTVSKNATLVEEQTLLKSEIEDLTAKNEELTKMIGISEGRKSVLINKSYTERFNEDGTKADQKGGVQTFNLKNKTDRDNLKTAIMEKSGLNKSEDYDKGLVSIAQEIELTGTLSKAADIVKLRTHGFQLVAE